MQTADSHFDIFADAPAPVAEATPEADERARARAKSGSTGSQAAHEAADALGMIREWGKVYSLTATHCTCCGQALRDAVSVTRGIGPICSQKYYNIDTPITDDMVAKALGMLYASNLHNEVKLAAKRLKDTPRDLCNVLVWWSAAHLDDADTVLEIAGIVTALGFEGLGDRLRERNTDVVVTETDDDSGDFIVRCRSTLNVRRNMRRVKEATPVPREGRFKYGWRFPANRVKLVQVILGEDFGNQWATVPSDVKGGASKVVKLVPRTWRDVRAAFEATYPRPTQRTKVQKAPIVRMVTDTYSGLPRIEVHTPSRNLGFVSELKAQVPYPERKWNPQQRCWFVKPQHEALARGLVAKHFNGMV